MRESRHSDFEGALYRALAAYQSQKPGAIGGIYTLLVNSANRPIPDGALPGLMEMLKISRDDIKVAAAVALQSMGERAARAVDPLKKIALEGESDAANAAVCALGGIPGEASVSALLEILERCKKGAPGGRAFFIASMFVLRPGDLTQHLPRLEEALREMCTDDEYEYKAALDLVRIHARDEQSLRLESSRLPNEIDIRQAHARLLSGDVDGAFPSRHLPDGVGPILKDRFQFRVTTPSDVGLIIHRHPHEANRYLVILSNDGLAYGDLLGLCFEDVASAVREVYGLRKANVTWVEHNAPSSGTTIRESEEYEHVTFGRENQKTHWLADPEWSMIRSIDTFIATWHRATTGGL